MTPLQAKQENEKLFKWFGTKDMLELDKERLTEQQIAERAGTYKIFWKAYFENDLVRIMYEQLKFMGKNVESDQQIIWLRGILEGFDIIRRYFEEQENIANAKFGEPSSQIPIMEE